MAEDVEGLKARILQLESMMKGMIKEDNKKKDDAEEKASDTKLEWRGFEWKLHDDLYLRGPDNVQPWLDAFSIALQSIGFKTGMTVTATDESKIANMITGKLRENPMRLVSGLSSGSAMIERIRTTYQPRGDQAKMSLWEELHELKYDGQDPVNYVTRFTHLVNRNGDVGNAVTDAQQRVLFLKGAQDEAEKWTTRQRTLLRVAAIEIQALKDDFIAEYRDRIPTGNKHESKGKKTNNMRRKGACRRCGKKGHWERECPENNTDNKNGNTNANQNTNNTRYSPQPPAGYEKYVERPTGNGVY